MFSNTGRILSRELKRIRRYPSFITLMVILPVVAFTYFGFLFSEGVARDIPIAVVDDDRTSMSRTLIDMFDATPSAQVAYTVQDLGEGEKLMKQGVVSAVTYIPRDFEKNILNNRPTTVVAYVSGVNITANGLVSKDLQTVATTYSSGVEIQLLMKNGLSEAEAYTQMMPVYLDKHVMFNPYINYGYYLLPSFMPMMLMVFTLLLTVFAIGTELRNGTAGEWLETAGGRIWPAVTGKLMPYTIAMLLMGAFMNVVMYKWLGVPMEGSLAIMIIANVLFVLAYQSVGILIISLLANLRLSLSLGGGYSVLAFTFSGLTFPRMAMSTGIKIMSYIFPFTLYTDVFVDQAVRGAPIVYSVQYLGLLSLFVLLPLLCLPRLKKVATDKTYWGRL